MKSHLVKNAIRRHKWDNLNGPILTKLSGIITNYFSSLIANLEDFIATFDDEDEFTAEQQCELLPIMVERGALSPGWWYSSFHGLLYETWIYPQFKSTLGNSASTLINLATCLASADLLTHVNMEQAARQAKINGVGSQIRQSIIYRAQV